MVDLGVRLLDFGVRLLDFVFYIVFGFDFGAFLI